MDKRGLVLSVLGLSVSFLTLVIATFAWFAISTTVDNSMLGMNVGAGIFPSYDIHYYTYDHVYKYDQSSESILVYDGGFWVAPSYEVLPESAYAFQGIMIGSYDPLVPINNEYDNIIIELHLYCDADESMSFSLGASADTSMAAGAVLTFGDAGTIYYLSQIAYLQEMETDNYQANPEGTNIYSSLKSDFETVDGNEDLIYPLHGFYDEYDSYVSETSLGSLSVTSATTDVYLYFNISYNTVKIDTILSGEGSGSTITSVVALRFYQDIKIYIEEASGS